MDASQALTKFFFSFSFRKEETLYLPCSPTFLTSSNKSLPSFNRANSKSSVRFVLLSAFMYLNEKDFEPSTDKFVSTYETRVFVLN